MARTKGIKIYAGIAPGGRAYIGQTIQDGDKRKKQHTQSKKGVNSKVTQIPDLTRSVTFVNLRSVPDAILMT